MIESDLTVRQNVDIELVYIKNTEQMRVQITLNPGLVQNRGRTDGGLTPIQAGQARGAQPTIRLRRAHQGLQLLQNLIPQGGELQRGGGHGHFGGLEGPKLIMRKDLRILISGYSG